METSRIEAFSDGVIAIIITIMVLELKVPDGNQFSDLRQVAPTFLSYVISFLVVGMYWNNHHHMLKLCRHASGGVMWANLGFIFFLSLIPVATAWVGDTVFDKVPVALYAILLTLCNTAWYGVQRAIVSANKDNRLLERALGSNRRQLYSVVFTALGIPLAFLLPWITVAIIVVVNLLWLVPDKRIEKVHRANAGKES